MYKCVAIISLAAVALVGCGEKDADTAATATEPTITAPAPGTSGSSAPAESSAAPSSSESGSAGSVPDAAPAPSSTDTAQQTGAHPPDKEMTPKEESESMPKPGQANDYSTSERSNAMGTGSK